MCNLATDSSIQSLLKVTTCNGSGSVYRGSKLSLNLNFIPISEKTLMCLINEY
jgi:hypothetical protein